MEIFLTLHSCCRLQNRSLICQGSEVNSFDQCSLQGDAELIESVQYAGEGVDSSSVPQQRPLLVRPQCQRKLCQQWEPLREKPVPARKKSTHCFYCQAIPALPAHSARERPAPAASLSTVQHPPLHQVTPADQSELSPGCRLPLLSPAIGHMGTCRCVQ